MKRFIQLLIATTNSGKHHELADMLSEVAETIISLTDLKLESPIKETGDTFTANALLKAKYYAVMSSYPTLADDSGLCVAALQGRPGVYSKRYGSTDKRRLEKLLQELSGFPSHQRQAYFSTSLALHDSSTGSTVLATGRIDGFITTQPKSTNGFGYDPIFYAPELGKTFGQATAREKLSCSHRSRAVAQLLKQL